MDSFLEEMSFKVLSPLSEPAVGTTTTYYGQDTPSSCSSRAPVCGRVSINNQRQDGLTRDKDPSHTDLHSLQV